MKIEQYDEDSAVLSGKDLEVPSLVDVKRMYLARVSDFGSWDRSLTNPKTQNHSTVQDTFPSIYE